MKKIFENPIFNNRGAKSARAGLPPRSLYSGFAQACSSQWERHACASPKQQDLRRHGTPGATAFAYSRWPYETWRDLRCQTVVLNRPRGHRCAGVPANPCGHACGTQRTQPSRASNVVCCSRDAGRIVSRYAAISKMARRGHFPDAYHGGAPADSCSGRRSGIARHNRSRIWWLALPATRQYIDR